MRSERSWPLFHVCTSSFTVRGSCWLLLGGALLFAWLAPLVTPWEEKPVILQPARAQAAWLYVWLALFTWLPFQGAALGHRLRREGILEHLRAGGLKPAQLFMQINASVLIWAAALAVIAAGVCVVFCSPSNPTEAARWFGLVVQYAVLYGVVAMPLLMLSVALGTRTSEVIAFLAPVGLLFLGLFGSGWLEPMLTSGDNGVFKTLWMLIPHYHLADLTPRLVFKMGPLPLASFFQTVICLGLEGVAFFLLGLCAFRTRS
ncbi:ABC transporter permease [Verrucomicrobium sp. BvORR034]|jgi:hypothetical protein|uniref:ABC transporter permease n=1 Tax=Verrucomicrobium sp. BvORR034 TaxID=1396418 RepID=UPI0006789096|nr:ABC transporter permease [Verrucomicrobium sp. BvORR034]